MSGTPRPRPGTGPCPDCRERVLFALAVNGDLVALSTGQDGPWAVRWDITDTPRCRRVPADYQPRKGEHRFRPHPWSCKALARVRAIGSAPSLRPAITAPRPVPRRASAR
jgi:hypothetical protein